MVNRFKTLVGVFILLGSLSTVHAQRFIDAEPNVIYPQPGHWFISPGTDSMQFYIVNHGPDTIYESDVFYNFWKLANVYPDPPFIRPFNRDVYPGDSILITHVFSLKYYNLRPEIDFCVDLRIWATDKESIFRERDSAELNANNKKCITVAHNRLASNNNKLSWDFSVYPNPTTKTLFVKTLHLNSQTLYVKVFNHLGTIVYDYRRLMNNSKQLEIDVSSLSSGMYYLQITDPKSRAKHQIRFVKT